MRKAFGISVVVLLIIANAFSATKFVPTTTLSAETGNNTSASDQFHGETNGNSAPGNVSKVDTRALLYAGSNTAIFAHYMPWFGTSRHIDVGYSSTDSVQVARQLDDMLSRGIQGVIVDWYGRNSTHADQSTELVLKEAEKHPGFKFALMEDGGALKNGHPTTELIADLIYAAQNYQESKSYLRVNGRPVVFFFGVEKLAIDWNAVRALAPGKPVFVFQNAVGLALSYSDGAFGWVNGVNSPGNWGQSYLATYYSAAGSSAKQSFGATWKGFNDTLAGWSSDRVMSQNCGQTWLNTFAEIGKHYSSRKQLNAVQLVTWNDYEEGTALEMGIDNCVTVTGSASGSTLTWNVKGNESTIHHYTIFLSQDGEQMMPLADLEPGKRSLDLHDFDLPGGAYNVYVKAVGQPSIRNQMSAAITWTNSVAGPVVKPTPTPSPVTPPASNADLNLSATPATLSVSDGTSASTTLLLTPTGDFNQAITLSCKNLPAGASCSFDKNEIVPGTKVVSATLTVKVDSVTTSKRAISTHGFLAVWFPGLGFAIVVLGDRSRVKKLWSLVLIMLLTALLMSNFGCASIAQAPSSDSSQSRLASRAGSYTFSIVAQAGSTLRSIPANLNIK